MWRKRYTRERDGGCPRLSANGVSNRIEVSSTPATDNRSLIYPARGTAVYDRNPFGRKGSLIRLARGTAVYGPNPVWKGRGMCSVEDAEADG